MEFAMAGPILISLRPARVSRRRDFSTTACARGVCEVASCDCPGTKYTSRSRLAHYTTLSAILNAQLPSAHYKCRDRTTQCSAA
eukprot:6210715-Pleurochrysis_carterae.AAC.1